jgi:DIM1 family U5 snRNP protein
MGSVVLTHLNSGWHVVRSLHNPPQLSALTSRQDQAILSEEERLVVIRFGRDADPNCMRQDEVLYRMSVAPIPAPTVLY